MQRYLDGTLEGTYKLWRGSDPDGPEACAALDAEWTANMVAAGHHIRIEIDDPHNDIGVKVVIVNGTHVE